MKALILNSGLGTRMGVLTSGQPKCMTEIFGTETILLRQLRQLNEAGVKEIVITTGAHHELLKNYVETMSMPVHVTFVLNKIYADTNYIYSIYCARDYLDDDILLMHGDLVFENEVLDEVMEFPESCMVVSSTFSLPEKDFKAVVQDGRISKIGIEFYDNALAAQPLYKLKKEDWKIWLDNVTAFCESGEPGKLKCYAENAFNEVSNKCFIAPLDIKDMLCSEIDTPEDLKVVSDRVRQVEQKTVYVSFSTDIIHSGHIALIKKARRLGKVIVGVISDNVVASYKRYPLLPFEERKSLFENIKGVSEVVEQNTLSYKTNIERFHPAYVVHGDDWKEGFQKPIRDEVIELLAAYSGKLIEFPYANDPKYRRIERQNATAQKMLFIENNYDVLDDYLTDNNAKSLMIVCGKSVEYHPLYGHICSLRETLGIKLVRYSDFTPNPKYEDVCRGVEIFNNERCDSILALGGGSTMDVAKCIKLFSIMDRNKSYLEQRIEESNILLMAIPTTAGTGSEVTRYAVIYFEGIKQSISHESCIPAMVFIDPSFLKTVPQYHRISTMLDALCHGIESYWSVNSTDESKSYAREAIGLILDNMNSYLSNDNCGNIAIQRASQLAGQAINITQTTAGHAMCYMLTSLFGIAHGMAAALCVNQLWPWLIKNVDKCNDKRGPKYLLASLRELAMLFDCDTPIQAANKFDSILKGLNMQNQVCNTNFKKLDKPDAIAKLLKGINSERMANHPINLSEDTIEKMYANILSCHDVT